MSLIKAGVSQDPSTFLTKRTRVGGLLTKGAPMDRVEEYLADRLRGRPVPADLRRLVELELGGVLASADCPLPLAEVHVLGPGELHPLLDPQYRRADDDAGTSVNRRALDETLAHAAVVVDGFNGDLFGYWLHPDEAPAQQPAIIKLDTEGEVGLVPGASLVEAMVVDWLGWDAEPDTVEPITGFCRANGLELSGHGLGELPEPNPAVDPALLADRLYREYSPSQERPATAGDVATAAAEDAQVVGLRVTDPPLRRLLDRLGLPADLGPTFTEQATGAGKVRLSAPAANVDLIFYRDKADWWLFEITYHRPTPDKPLPVPIPLGFSFQQPRAAAAERWGKPRTAQLVPVDRWDVEGIVAYVWYLEDDRPRYVRFWTNDADRR